MKTLLRNAGVLVSGDIRHPVLDADSLLLRDGVIATIGRGLDDDADTVIDARGTTVPPGGISMVLVDGKTTIGRSRNTPPAAWAAEVLKGAGPTPAGH
jgi:N-acyl-D-aspartate/D-glutamate deacylase